MKTNEIINQILDLGLDPNEQAELALYLMKVVLTLKDDEEINLIIDKETRKVTALPVKQLVH